MGVIRILNQQLDNAKIILNFLKDYIAALTVVFILLMSLLNILILGLYGQSNRISGEELFGTPFDFSKNNLSGGESAYSDEAAFYSIGSVDVSLGGESDEIHFIIVDSAALLSESNPLSNILPTREGLMIYKVQKGDNISRIAANFGISVNTILWANENLKSDLLRPGQEIIILPVTGVLYQVKEGETIDMIANQYNMTVEKIMNANPNMVPAKLSAGSTVIIPDTSPLRGRYSNAGLNLPSLPGYFAIPTTGWNWGQLHEHNAVDIANACGTPIYASAEGLVIEEIPDGWNGGYGAYILIEHPNGTKTKYAHTEKNLVSAGDYILKGDTIAYIGNTGNTHGPTGCHLHFEIYGAKNPFAK